MRKYFKNHRIDVFHKLKTKKGSLNFNNFKKLVNIKWITYSLVKLYENQSVT